MDNQGGAGHQSSDGNLLQGQEPMGGMLGAKPEQGWVDNKEAGPQKPNDTETQEGVRHPINRVRLNVGITRSAVEKWVLRKTKLWELKATMQTVVATYRGGPLGSSMVQAVQPWSLKMTPLWNQTMSKK